MTDIQLLQTTDAQHTLAKQPVALAAVSGRSATAHAFGEIFAALHTAPSSAPKVEPLAPSASEQSPEPDQQDTEGLQETALQPSEIEDADTTLQQPLEAEIQAPPLTKIVEPAIVAPPITIPNADQAHHNNHRESFSAAVTPLSKANTPAAPQAQQLLEADLPALKTNQKTSAPQSATLELGQTHAATARPDLQANLPTEKALRPPPNQLEASRKSTPQTPTSADGKAAQPNASAQLTPVPNTPVQNTPVLNTPLTSIVAQNDAAKPELPQTAPVVHAPATLETTLSGPSTPQPASITPNTAAPLPKVEPQKLPLLAEPTLPSMTPSAKTGVAAESSHASKSSPSPMANSSRSLETANATTTPKETTPPNPFPNPGPLAIPNKDSQSQLEFSISPTSEPLRSETPTPSQPSALPTRQTELARQVAMQIASTPKQENRAIELRLHPEELGRVRLLLSPGETAMTVSIVAERGETLDLMRRHISQLETEFQELGYDDVTFTFGSSPQGNADQNSPQHDDGQGTPKPELSGSKQQESISGSHPQSPTQSGLDLRF
ncbi:flagellar hook-length control protein FliK [Rhodobacteraceae bacterium D3-12]|nr:flagellar hook-length control protein FliK [Rhodobacteraceae bacterium D3-12]